MDRQRSVVDGARAKRTEQRAELPDGREGEDRHVRPDLGPALDRRPALAEPGLTARMRVIHHADPRRDGHAVLDGGAARDVAVRMDLHAVADRAVRADDCVVPDATVAPDDGVGADHDVATRLQPVPDPYAVVHGGAGADERIVADLEPFPPPRWPGLAAQPDIVLDHASGAHAHPGQEPARVLRRSPLPRRVYLATSVRFVSLHKTRKTR